MTFYFLVPFARSLRADRCEYGMGHYDGGVIELRLGGARRRGPLVAKGC